MSINKYLKKNLKNVAYLSVSVWNAEGWMDLTSLLSQIKRDKVVVRISFNCSIIRI